MSRLVLIVAIAAVFGPTVGAGSTLHTNARLSTITLTAGTAGMLDRTFGGSGFVVIPHNVYSVNDVRVSSHGDIVVAVDFAGMANAIGGFGIERLLTNGAPNNAFGNGGIAVAQFSRGINAAMSSATQADGKIVAVGFSKPLFGGASTMAIARFTQNGGLDASFGSGGRLAVLVPNSSASSAGVILVLPNGKLLVGGAATFGSGGTGVLLQLNANGTIDGSFGIGGFTNTGLTGQINGLGLQSDGKIVALDGAVANRFLPSGALDPNTSRGTLVAETHNRESMLTFDERIVVGEGLSDGNHLSDIDTDVFRLFPNGSIDTTFRSPLFDFITTNPDNFQDVPHAIAIQSNGSIIVGGEAHLSSGGTEFALARVLGTGSFDASFGQSGIAVSRLDGSDQLLALGLQPNGDILAAGIAMSNNGGLVVARYLPR